MATNNIPNVVPWGLHPLKPWVEEELIRRAKEIDMNTDVQKYSGPRTAWTRFFSNGISPNDSAMVNGVLEYNHEGFVMGGVHGFDNSYGFNEQKRIILGYDANGQEHSILASANSSFPHRPPPSIESVDVTLYGGQNSSYTGLCRKARVNWKCYSLDQLKYLAPYFLMPKVTALVEWGWDNYDPSSLIDLRDKEGMVKLLFDGEGIMDRIERSRGNYDAMIGFIFDYEFKMNSLGGYDCYTEFVNANWLLEGKEYKSEAILNSSDGEPRKKFVEFINADARNCILLKDKKNNQGGFIVFIKNRFFEVTPEKITNMGSLGASEKKIWLRMDAVTDIFNKYFKYVFRTINKIDVGDSNILDISKTFLCGHPGLKSTDIDILVPNQFAPRFTTKRSEELESSEHEQRVAASTISSTTYSKLFEQYGISNFITKKSLTTEYDDLKKLINASGHSFPMYEKGTDEETKNCSSGTWGYLSDIFVSVDLLQAITSEQDSAYRMIETLLNRINDALCGVVQLKVVPHSDAAKYTILDMNFNPNSTPSSVKDLVRFTPGSVNSAFITNTSFTVKLSQEMANQMVAQSSAGRSVDDIQIRTGTQNASRFVGNDRLYDYATVDVTEPSVSSADSKKEISKRDFSKDFYFYQNGDENNKKYILVEKDKEFMKSVVMLDKSGKSIYINSPMMPGTKFEMETLGIGGFTFLGQFTLDHVPAPYDYKNCVWQIADIVQKVSNNNWVTTIKADCRPLSYIG